MGIITICLVAGGFLHMTPEGKLPDIPLWVEIAACAAIALGTLSGGWRIVKTMGTKIVKLAARPGILCGDGRVADAVWRDFLWDSRLDDSHDHRRDRRRRLGKAFLRRQMGRRGPHRLGVGAHDTRRRRSSRPLSYLVILGHRDGARRR